MPLALCAGACGEDLKGLPLETTPGENGKCGLFINVLSATGKIARRVGTAEKRTHCSTARQKGVKLFPTCLSCG